MALRLTVKTKKYIMIKKHFTLVLTIFTLFTYGQNIEFQPNINYKAQILEQSLNEDGDSLLLKSNTEDITQVDIFNDNFSTSIDVNGNKTDIDLNDLPKGNFIIQARVEKKRIIMYLEKREDINMTASSLKATDKTIKEKAKKIKHKKRARYYWIVYERNSGMGSSKSMKLIHKDELSHLIDKNKLELKSETGKNNNLLIYAVYNKNKFMNKQFRNPEYFKSAKTCKSFNSKPIYTTENIVDNASDTPNLVTAL